VKKIYFTNSLHQKICGILEEPDSTLEQIVIMVHGHSSHKNGKSIRLVSEELKIRGINSLRIDLDGCGESEGNFEDQTISSAVDDIISTIKLMKNEGYARICLFGSSAGGMAVMATALHYSGIDKIGLKAPVADFPSHLLRKFGKEYIAEWKEKGHHYFTSDDGRILKWNYTFFEDSRKYNMYDHAQKFRCPVLIVHGTSDKSVDIEDSKKLVSLFPNGRLMELIGADHGLAIEGDRSYSLKIFGDYFKE
jgi:hypothetical protein